MALRFLLPHEPHVLDDPRRGPAIPGECLRDVLPDVTQPSQGVGSPAVPGLLTATPGIYAARIPVGLFLPIAAVCDDLAIARAMRPDVSANPLDLTGRPSN